MFVDCLHAGEQRSLVKPRGWCEAARPRRHGRPCQEGGYREVPFPSRGAHRDSALSILSTRMLGWAPGLVDELLGTTPVGTLTAHCVRVYVRPSERLLVFAPALQPTQQMVGLLLSSFRFTRSPQASRSSPVDPCAPHRPLNRTIGGSAPAGPCGLVDPCIYKCRRSPW